MKNAITFALALLVSTPVLAARAPDFYTLDMTGRHFEDQDFNLMDDGMGSYDGLQIKLRGRLHKDFEIMATHSERHDESCGVGRVITNGGASLVEINASVETDSGESCNYTITYQDGTKAVLQVYETGT